MIEIDPSTFQFTAGLFIICFTLFCVYLLMGPLKA